MTSLVSRIVPSNGADGFSQGINRLAVSPNSRFMATGDVDMNVVVTGEDAIVYQANFRSPNDKSRPTERIRGLCFSPNSEFLYVAAGEQILAIHTLGWKVSWTYTSPRSFGFLIISPISLDVADNGCIAAAFDNGTVLIWNSEGHLVDSLRENDSPRWLRFVAEGKTLVGSDSFSICSWQVGHRHQKSRIVLKDRAFGIDVNSAGNLAAVRNLHAITLWDLETHRQLASAPVGSGIPLVIFHPLRDWVAYGERNRIRIIDSSGNLITDFELAVASALSIAFSSDGSEMLIGCTMRKLLRRKISGLLEKS